MRRCGWLPVLALLLAGCGSHPTRPSRPSYDKGSHPPPGQQQAPSRARDAFRDDIQKDQASRYRDGNDSVPSGPPPDLSSLVEPVPHVEPRSAYGNKSPYTVLGRTYRVLPSAKGYVERGIASFYGNKFHGYKTSSLEN